ncbi:TPA: glycosyltransferase family 2 protein [Streptococcus suis]|nr:glycosyltransferase family 2 protein [Streptococcus suis]HEM6111853.1 glycosyltransferase family 2 protein [Streptococcus suis]HEM6309741.1 glycosyltransferase family 2 protein [Streptococcus suis]HEM6319804.1 glycosyltransferase family 2 protein [Streptococcus suis]
MNFQNEIPLVSVIIPMYNARLYIAETIQTVLQQSYSNVEIILVDDCSNDGSYEHVSKIFGHHSNISIFQNLINSGVGHSRNVGVAHAKGRFICFLDADDLWLPRKLEKQVKFMLQYQHSFTFTAYQFADESGQPVRKPIQVPSRISYKEALKNHTIWTSTVMLDMASLSKEQIAMPDVRKGQDTATWWKILKVTEYAYSINEVLSLYRRTPDSLSANKLSAINRTWNLFRNVEGLTILQSIIPFCGYALNAIKRRI